MAYYTNSRSNTVVSGTDYNDYITNYISSDRASILGFAGNDSIYNYGTNAVIYGGDGHDDILNISNGVFISGGNGADSISSNGDYGMVVGDAGYDTLFVQGNYNSVSGGANNDLIILDSTYNNNNAINYSLGDGYDTVYGFNSSDVVWVYDTFWSTSTVGNDVVLSFLNGSLTLKNTAQTRLRIALNITDNTNNSRILAGTEIIDANTRNRPIKITCNELSNEIYGGSGNDSLYGGDGNDSIYGNAGKDKLYGQAGDDKISGGDDNDSLYGGIGNDILSGDNGNDYLKGGDGNDVFIYSAGNDVIADYTAGQDKIKLFNASIKSSATSGSDVVFTLSTGKLTVTGGKNQNITIIDANGNETSKKYGASTASTLKTVTNSTSSPVTVGSAVKTIDASTRTTAVKITGNSLANTIKGGSGNDSLSGMAGDDKITAGNGKDTLTGGEGKDLLYGQAGDDKIYGQAGNDSLYGGNGKDSLWGGVGNDWLKGGLGNDFIKGGDGSDTFIYGDGDGKDIISGFENGDLLQITGTFSASYNSSKKEIYFKVGSTAKAITLTDFTATTFHVNNDTYQISGNKFVKK